jgi:hypothetical protein
MWVTTDPDARDHTFDGFTNELSLKVAVDFTDNVSANVKLCYGCHGFEVGMAYVDLMVVDEFRIGPAETYDVIVEPVEDRAYTIFAETIDRSGYARGTLAPRPGMSARIPARRPRPRREPHT